MQVVIKVVNFVETRDLNCLLFKDFCSTENAEHGTLLLYTAVRCLSHGSALKRVFILRNEVKDFLHNRKNENATFFQMICSLPALRSWLMLLRNWMSWILHCKVEANGCLNCKFPFVLLLTSWLFSSRKQKPVILVCFHITRNFLQQWIVRCHFQNLVQYLTSLQANFKERFPKLQDVSYRHVQFPFRVDAEACGDLALEVAELQADENQKIQFEDSDLASFWLNTPKKYAFLKNDVTKAVVQFGSTYVCEGTFSCMVCIKSKYRNWLTDAHLQDNLIIATTTYAPRFRSLLCEPSTHLFCQTDLGPDWFYHFVTLLSNYFGTSVFHFRVWSAVSTFKWDSFTPAYIVA